MSVTEPQKFSPPSPGDYAEYYHQYVSLFEAADFLEGFAAQIEECQKLFGDLTDEVCETVHEPYSWTLKQVMGHLIDCERIFSTRALRIGVGDKTPLPGIDQNIFCRWTRL